MSLTTSNLNRFNPARFFNNLGLRPAVIIGLIIVTALLFFEMFNYSTTDYALRDLLGDLRFAGIRWATALSIAFCAIDFAGIARLFTPTQGDEEPKEVWYLFGAWLLAAAMNAVLTWWGVSMAIVNHNVQSAAVVDPSTILKIVPVFVALMVWVIRILIIGSISVAGDRLLWGSRRRSGGRNNMAVERHSASAPAAVVNSAASLRPGVAASSSHSVAASPARRPSPSVAMPRAAISTEAPAYTEPTYHSISMNPTQTRGNSQRNMF